MTSTQVAAKPHTSQEETFQTGEVLTIVGGHFIHDTFPAFLAPLLPALIEKMSMSLTLAGSLQFFVQFPALITPFVGYLADRVSLRYFVILAPAVTATSMSLLGMAPNYAILAIILFASGISIACFHAPAPAMISRISGDQIGKGMSLFMAGGELGRTIGPLLVAWAVSVFTLEGMYPVMFIGWLASFILYRRLRDIPARTAKPQHVRAVLPTIWRVFVPMVGVLLPRAFMLIPIQVYLPTLMKFEGASLIDAAFYLTVWELAGVGGALLGGTLSDRLGRRAVLLFSLIMGPGITLLLLQSTGGVLVGVLLLNGFVALSTNPVLMAITQEHMPDNRAVANGVFISLAFAIRPLTAVIIGYLGDTFGLEAAFFWGAIISLLAVPSVFFLPRLEE